MLKPPYKVLVVDDEKDVCDVIQSTLEVEFADRLQIQVCHKISDAIEIIKKEDIRIILSDFHLPGERGDTLLQKAQEMHSGIRFIMVTGDLSLETVLNSFLDGAVSILAKPFTPDELIKSISACVLHLEYWQKKFSQVN